MNHPSHIFREYDIRGVAGSELSERFAYELGVAFGERVAATGGEKIMIAYDGRISSPALASALCTGIAHAEVEPVSIGLGPTPMLYHAVCSEKAGGGIMITGSHNPPDQNGFKMMLGDHPFYGEDIQSLRVRLSQPLPEVPLAYHTLKITPYPAYLDHLAFEALNALPLRVVWDCGNGATGNIIRSLIPHLKGMHIVLNGEVDGTFPAHHPDPSDPRNMEQLIAEVVAQQADIGIAFDGDGDRIGVVDSDGVQLAGDQLLCLFAADVLSRHEGACIIADVKSSHAVETIVRAFDGNPLMWKTGHSNIKAKMKTTGALLAGEMSGHLFLAEDYFGFDDAILAAVRLLCLLGREQKSLKSLRLALPAYFSTPELRIPVTEEEKFDIIARVAEQLSRKKANILAIDGVRVTTADGWWLLRASNTQAILVARAESSTQAGLCRLIESLNSHMQDVGLQAVNPVGESTMLRAAVH